MNYVNLGCGTRYFDDWINYDFTKHSEEVIQHNLLKGIPLDDNSVDVVYHSHFLEHFTRQDGEFIIRECFRVLKKGGILRIVVPDLEKIVRAYLNELDKAKRGDKQAVENHEWMVIFLYDQAVRTTSGGEMSKYLQKEEINNLDFVVAQVGKEAEIIRDSKRNIPIPKRRISQGKSFSRFLKPKNYYFKLKQLISKDDQGEDEFQRLGRFRMSGEVHQWMYDEVSLSQLLEDVGFHKWKIQGPSSSYIPQWEKYQSLDVEDGKPLRPESLFMEGIKG